MDPGENSVQHGTEDMTISNEEGSRDSDDLEEESQADITETVTGEESQSPSRTTSSKKRKSGGSRSVAKKRCEGFDAIQIAMEVLHAKKILEGFRSKPIPIFREVGQRVKAVADAHGQGDQFIIDAMELIREQNDMEFFLGFPTDGSAYYWLTKKLYEKGLLKNK